MADNKCLYLHKEQVYKSEGSNISPPQIYSHPERGSARGFILNKHITRPLSVTFLLLIWSVQEMFTRSKVSRGRPDWSSQLLVTVTLWLFLSRRERVIVYPILYIDLAAVKFIPPLIFVSQPECWHREITASGLLHTSSFSQLGGPRDRKHTGD